MVWNECLFIKTEKNWVVTYKYQTTSKFRIANLHCYIMFQTTSILQTHTCSQNLYINGNIIKCYHECPPPWEAPWHAVEVQGEALEDQRPFTCSPHQYLVPPRPYPAQVGQANTYSTLLLSSPGESSITRTHTLEELPPVTYRDNL